MRYLIILAAVLVSGCATINADYTQPITVLAVCAGSSRPVEAECVLYNDKSRKIISSPGTVAIARSSSELHVQCSRHGAKNARAVLNSTGDEKILGNLVVGGVVGALVDAGTGAAFNYPNRVTVLMDCSTGLLEKK